MQFWLEPKFIEIRNTTQARIGIFYDSRNIEVGASGVDISLKPLGCKNKIYSNLRAYFMKLRNLMLNKIK